jgi:twinkle protein
MRYSKTTFLGQMSLDLAEQDVNVLWGSFEIKNTRLIHKLMQQFVREPLPTGDAAMSGKLEAIADRFARLPLYFLKFHGGSDVDDVLDAMDYAVCVYMHT